MSNTTTGRPSARFEYPDAAGYPDGTGFLDEGTAARVETHDAVVDLDRPSADAESEVRVHRDDAARVYAATVDGRSVAEIRYDAVDGRVVIVSTTVEPEFRGRGIADELIAYALDDIRDLGAHVTVYCPTVSRFIAENRQFSDLIDPVYPGR
jgi:predicted GNAT family acetyltransferase